MRPPRILLLMSFLVLLVSPAVAGEEEAQENVGFSPNHAFASGGFGETVDVTSGNLTLQVPIGPSYKVNDLSYGIVLTYNSKIWDYRYPMATTEESRRPYLKNRWTYGAGWTFHAGRIYIHPRASYDLPEKIFYEAPDGTTHGLYPEDGEQGPNGPNPITESSWYYSEDSSYLRARAYTVHEDNDPTKPTMRIWKLWEPDGTARVLGYQLGYGRPPNYHTGTPYPNEPPITVPFPYPAWGATGWYTIRVESPRQRNLDAPGADPCVTDALDLIGVLSPVSGNPREVPCSWVEYFYAGSLPPEETDPLEYHSRPTEYSISFEPYLSYITDSAGRQIDVKYGSAAAPDAVAFFLPGLAGTQVRYGLDMDGPNRLNSPQAPELLYEKWPDGCYAAGDMPTTAANVDTLSRVTYPLGLVMDFDYFHPDCASHGMVTARVLPTGAKGTYEYKLYSLRMGGDQSLSVTKKTFEVAGQPPAVWEYSRDPIVQSIYGVPPNDPGGPWNPTVYSNPPRVYEVDPDGNLTITHLHTNLDNPVNGNAYSAYGLPWMVERLKGRSLAAAVVARQKYEYGFDAIWYQDPFDQYTGPRGGLGQPSAHDSQPSNLRRVSVEESIFQNDGTELLKRTESADFDPFGRPQRSMEHLPGATGSDTPILRTSETRSLLAAGNPDLLDTPTCPSVPNFSVPASALPLTLRERWILDTSTSSTLLRSGTGPEISRSRTECFDVLGFPIRTRSWPNPAVPGEYVQAVRSLDAYGNVTREDATSVGGLGDGITRTTHFGRDAAGHLRWKKQGDFTWRSYDRTVDLKTGLTTASRTPAGVNRGYAYDTLRRLKTISPGAPEVPTQITYPTPQQTVVTQGAGATPIKSEYFYDQAGRLIEEKRYAPDAVVNSRYTTYDVGGRKVFESEWVVAGTASPPGTSYEYTVPLVGPPGPVPPGTAPENMIVDPLGRVTRVVAADGATTESSYNALVTTIRTRDLNRVPGNTGVIPGLPHEAVSVYTNDAFGRLLQVDAPDGDDATYSYDEQDHLTRVEMGDQVREFVYDGLGRLTSSSNPESGLVQFQGYDPKGQLLKTTDAAGVVTQVEYDQAGRLLRERRGGAVPRVLKELTYDTAIGICTNCTGRLTGVCYEDEIKTDAQLGSSPGVCTPTVRRELRYGGLNGRLAEERLILEGFPNDPLTTTYSYTNFGEVGEIAYPERTPAGHLPTVVTYGYQRGFLVHVGDDLTAARFVADVGYNPAGGKRLVKYGNGVWSEFIPDAQNRPQQLKVWTYGPGAQDRRRGRPEAIASGAATPPIFLDTAWLDARTIAPSMDAAANSAAAIGRPSLPRDLLAYAFLPEIIPDPGGGGGSGPPVLAWDSGAYSYDGAGNIIAIGQDAFLYDALSRLVASTMRNLPGPPNSDTVTEVFTYDGAGNMTARTKQAPGSTFVYSFGVQNATNRLQSLGVEYQGTTLPNDLWDDFEHDAVGNLLRDDQNSYVWDPQGRLREVRTRPGAPDEGTLRGLYAYDDRGYRYRKVEDGIETFYVRDLEGRVLSEFRRAADTNVFPVWDQDYIYALGGAIALLKNDTPQPPRRLRMLTDNGNGGYTMRINWTKSDESDIEGYRVWRKRMDPEEGPFEPLFPAGGVSVEQDTAPDPVLYSDPNVPGIEYEYFVRTVDTAGNESMDSRHLQVDLLDSAAISPTWDTPALTPGDGTLQLHWSVTPAEAPHVVGYNVYCKPFGAPDFVLRNPGDLLESPGYLDVGLTNGVDYEYRVTAINTRMGESGVNLAVSRIDQPEDNVPPSPPPGARGQPGPGWGEVTLFWGASAASDVDGFTISEVGGTSPLLIVPDATDRQATLPLSAGLHHLVIRAYDDDDNESQNSTVVDVGPWAGAASVVVDEDGDGEVPEQRHSYDYGYPRHADRDSFLQINGPQRQFFEGPMPSRPAYGQPVLFRAAHLVVFPNNNPPLTTCPGIHIYRQGATSSDWERLTVQPLVGQPGIFEWCAVSYFDTTATGVTATYRVSTVGPDGLESATPLTPPISYVYGSTDAPWKVMGQYAFGANLVIDNPSNPFTANIAIPEEGGWELGSLPSKHPVVLRWRKPPQPEVAGYRIWVWDMTREGEGYPFWVPLPPITDPDTTQYLDDDALYGWPLVKTSGLWDYTRCISFNRNDVAPAVPCRTGQQWDNLTLYFVEALTDLEAPAPPRPQAGGEEPGWGDIWLDAVRAIRLNSDEACPTPPAFCDNCTGTPTDTCKWPEYAPGEDLYRINFTSPTPESGQANPYFYPGYENVSEVTTYPTPCGIEGEGQCGWWQETSGLESFEGGGYEPDERLDSSVYYPAYGQGTRTFRMDVGDGEYLVEIATGEASIMNTNAVVSVNGTSFWEGLDLPVDTHEVRRLRIVADENGFLNIVIGGGSQSTTRKTAINYVRVSTVENWTASLAPSWQDESGYFLATAPEAGGDESAPQVAAPAVLAADVSAEAVGTPQTIGWLEARVRRGAVLVDGEATVALVEVPAPDRLVGQLTPSVTVQWLHVDHLGSTRLVTDETGFEASEHKYRPFGEGLDTAEPSSPNTHEFTGHEFDAPSELDYMMARYYGVGSGRFLSPDPLSGNLLVPQSLSKYLYTINNPLKYVDPSGLDFYLIDKEGNKVKGGEACKEDGRCDKEGNLIVKSEELEDEEGEYSGTVNENGVQITGTGDSAAEGTFSAQFIANTPSVSLTGSGAFAGYTFDVTGDGGGKALASGTFTAPAGSEILGSRGAFFSIDAVVGLDKFLHPGTTNSYRFGSGPFTQLGETRELTCGERCNRSYGKNMSGWFDVDKDYVHSPAHVRCAIFGEGCQY